jgi:exonuclease III
MFIPTTAKDIVAWQELRCLDKGIPERHDKAVNYQLSVRFNSLLLSKVFPKATEEERTKLITAAKGTMEWKN